MGMDVEPNTTSFWVLMVSLGGVLFNLVVSLFKGAQTLDQSRKEINEKIEVKDKALTEELINLERRFKLDIDQSLRAVGESMSAIRTKMTDVELWGRDHYVDKNTFNLVITDLKRSWERFEEKLDKRLEGIEHKLDNRNSG